MFAQLYQCGSAAQIHVRIQRKSKRGNRTIPAALFLQLLPRLAAASRPLSLWRSRAVFATYHATASGIVELELRFGDLHVRFMVGYER